LLPVSWLFPVFSFARFAFFELSGIHPFLLPATTGQQAICVLREEVSRAPVKFFPEDNFVSIPATSWKGHNKTLGIK
jgi:hypothetical protein